MAANDDVDLSPPGLRLESPDGRSFIVRGPASERPRVGEYLEVEGADATLAFVEEVAADPAGEGFVATGSLVGGGSGATSDAGPRGHGLAVRPTEASAVQRLLSAPDPSTCTSATSPTMPRSGVALVPKRLNRHTFWCGQSGSGKTYALGVLLERILLTTRLPMVVFDPNSDFVRSRRDDLGG